MGILKYIYPGKKVKFVRPATLQPDLTSCGVFAIAFATTIILGGNPENVNLQLIDGRDNTKILRDHIKNMFLNNQINLFPVQPFSTSNILRRADINTSSFNVDHKPFLVDPLPKKKSIDKTLMNRFADIDFSDEDDSTEYDTFLNNLCKNEETLELAIKNLEKPYQTVTDDPINWFIINLVNETTYNSFYMRFVTYAQNIKFYRKIGDRNDIQIIFCGTLEDVGHYILVHFVKSENIVKIYDSLNGKTLGKSTIDILTRLYSGKSYQFITPAALQPDKTSCGVFVIAYATTIILGKDPATYHLKLGQRGDKSMPLRRHIIKMFRNKKLELFPE